MSIEQKIAQILAESRAAQEAAQIQEEEDTIVNEEVVEEEAVKPAAEVANPDNARNNVDNEDEAINKAPAKKANAATKDAAPAEGTHLKSVKEDVDALLNGEELSEEFKQKAETIFEAAVMTRVKAEVSRIEEEFNTKLQEATEQVKEGLVEQVDGYLD